MRARGRRAIRRGSHQSVQALGDDIRDWVDAWNKNPRPFIWTKSAEQILESQRDDTAILALTAKPAP